VQKSKIEQIACNKRLHIKESPRAAWLPQICCYANVRDLEFFETHEFYKTDILILRELGYEVVITNSVKKLMLQSSEIYFAWWFGYGILPALIGWFRRRPVVISGVLHTADGGSMNSWPIYKRWVMKLSMHLADQSIVCSQGEFERLDGFKPRNCAIVPLSIDTETYAWADQAQDQPRKRNILMITQLNHENVKRKMVVEAISAFAEFAKKRPDFKLQICGAIGDGIDLVQAAITKTNMEQHVEIVGRVSLEEKIKLLGSAFVYLQPTICEGFGLSIGEALACGTPVVTSPEKCVVEVYGDAVKYGGSEAELTFRLEELALDLDQYKLQQRIGFEHVKLYSFAHRREHFRLMLDGLRR
jgi:glycosyltransferase involved in cell wall biosynthesis